MQIAMVGLGRMGANMVRRLLKEGHQCVVYNRSPDSVASLAKEGATASASLRDMASKLQTPRVVWLMLPAGVVDETVKELQALLQPKDIIVDGGNSYYVDDLRRSKEVAASGLKWVDVGTSGGVLGLDRGYCMMIGGDKDTVAFSIPSSRPSHQDVVPPTAHPDARKLR